MKIEREKLEQMDKEVLKELPFCAYDMDGNSSYELNLLISLMYELEDYNNKVPDNLKLTLYLDKYYNDENFDYDTFNLQFNDDTCVSGMRVEDLDLMICGLCSIADRISK